MKKNKQIQLTYKDKEYTLEYDRKTVGDLENMGFSANQMVDKPAAMLPLLFKGAFIKNHRFLKEDIINDIFEHISDKQELIRTLGEMITETYTSLMESDESDTKEKNASWKIV